ncbi:uncharacterized protein SOCE836_001870 [Sorangium cellulosum]|uniref:Uncharacterized protein n=1 Tax=Sorangium cellulosum TaxID=56 RepID=A0A4P2QEE9_SORCE|nr:uncharacterized protein SOCE836_001870 [Sorangium cellulosum]WCQ87523.1 hypothetical protein NQZ70_00186 [Sorangium sp. Soce836]
MKRQELRAQRRHNGQCADCGARWKATYRCPPCEQKKEQARARYRAKRGIPESSTEPLTFDDFERIERARGRL